MHKYESKGGTIFNFNSDMSGEVTVRESGLRFTYTVGVPGLPLLEFVRWYIKEYEEKTDG